MNAPTSSKPPAINGQPENALKYQVCDEAGFSPKIALEAWQMAGMVSLVAADMGIALLPAQVRSTSHPDVVYKTLADESDHLELKVALAWRPDNHSAGVTSVLSLFDPAVS